MTQGLRTRCLLALAIAAIAIGGCAGDKGDTGDPGQAGPPGTGMPGPSGAAGPSGVTSLISVTEEAPGANCQFGGDRVDTGLDQDANGALDTAEIAATTYVCDSAPTVTDGDVVIHEPDDVAQLAGVAIVRGNLTIMPDPATGTTAVPLGMVDLSGLVEVTGDVRIEGNPGLKGIFLSKLVRVSGSILLDDNPDIEIYDIGKLTDVTNDILVCFVPNLHYLDIGSIQNVGGDFFTCTQSSPAPGSFINVKVPVYVGGDAQLGYMGGLPAVVIEGVMIVGGDLVLHANGNLFYVATNNQTYVGHDVYITDNPILSLFFAVPFAEAIHKGGQSIIYGNAP
jgi:hypothetical protein